MKVLVAGLSTQSSAAVELIIGSVFRGATIVQHPRGPGCTTVALASDAGYCDFCVIDLVGLGWTIRTPERETALQDCVLGDRPAIVLLPNGESGWAASAVLKDRALPRIGLLQPASMTSLQEALLQVRRRSPSNWAPRTADQARTAARFAATPAATTRGWAASAERRPALAEPVTVTGRPASELPSIGERSKFAPETAPQPIRASTATAVTPVAAMPAADSTSSKRTADGSAGLLSPTPFRLDGAEHRAVAEACPQLRDEAFLDLVLDRLERGTACEIRIGSRAGIVLCPERNWAVSNLSVALRRRIAQHRPMLDIIETRSLSPAEAARAARGFYGRRRDGRRALDTFVFSFVHALLGDDPPEVDGGLTFSLRRFPDFTRLQPVGDLHLQLALHALQRTQTVAELRATFARHDPRQVSLFVVCALLSGIGTTMLRTAPAELAAPARAERKQATRLGFIRSLLAKLF